MASASKVPIDGVCDARFTRVRDVFIENFESRGELGAAVAVTLDTQPRRKDPRADGRMASAPTTR